MDLEKLREKFPVGFPVEMLPEGAREECIEVYRVCRTGKVEEKSFLPTYLDELSLTKENMDESHGIEWYGMSTFSNHSEAKSKLKFFRGHQPVAILAKGVTAPECGMCQRTKQRTGHGKSHVDWWLYRNVKPHIHFEEIKSEEVV